MSGVGFKLKGIFKQINSNCRDRVEIDVNNLRDFPKIVCV